MRPRHLRIVLTNLLSTGQPIFLWGPPGIGKSSLVRQAAEKLGLDVVDIRAVLLDPVDLRGLPTVQDGQAHWCPPAFLPRDGRGVLFLDELAQAPPLVQAALLQLTLDRRLGEYELPEGWSIVAASNRQEDRAGTYRMISPLLARFIHVDLDVSVDDWLAWAVEAGIRQEVRAFIRFRPSLLFSFDPASGERAFPNPRSWAFLSQAMSHVTDDVAQAVYAGCVGEGPAAEFAAFVRTYRDLPDIDQVIREPHRFSPPAEPAVLYALVGAVAERAREADNQRLGRIFEVADRLPAEYGVLLVRDVVAANKRALTLPEAGRWLSSHRDLLVEAGGDA